MAAATQNFSVVRGDDWKHKLMFCDEDGRYVTDLITDGTATLRSATARFVDDDIGTLVATKDNVYIPDGTFITDVALDMLSCTLSANASSSNGKKVKGVIRASNLSNYTARAQVRSSADSNTIMYSLAIDTARKAVGVYIFSLSHTITAGLDPQGVYDLELTSTVSPFEVSTLCSGSVAISKDVTK